jgi:hypothetical protein
LLDLIYEEILLYHFEDFRDEYFRRIEEGKSVIKDVLENENALKVGSMKASVNVLAGRKRI